MRSSVQRLAIKTEKLMYAHEKTFSSVYLSVCMHPLTTQISYAGAAAQRYGAVRRFGQTTMHLFIHQTERRTHKDNDTRKQ